MSEVTTSFFYGGASAPEQNTTDQLLDQLQSGVQAASESASSASTSATNAANSAASAAGSAAAVGEAQIDAANSAANAANSAAAAAGSASESATSASSAGSSASSATSSAATATSKANEAASSASAAATSATNSANSASAAGTSATNAATSATAAASSATSASGSASTATTKASEASTSATNAAASASTASTKASEASTSATNAASSASSASTSAGTATTQAGIATTKASEAATSATNAAASATTASTKASEASTSATNAAASATSASGSASTATTKASEASASATAAAGSASTATTQASNASTSATNAANSASAASTSATNAATSATNAAASANAAAASYDSFDDRYLGVKSSDPTVDNDGNALLTGALYFNSTSNVMKVYDGAAWVAAYASLSGALIAANNLSDLANAVTARTNLGLGPLATKGGSSDIYWDNTNGRLGIGTASPVAKLDTRITTPTTTNATNLLYGGDGTYSFTITQTGPSYNYGGVGGNELVLSQNGYSAFTIGNNAAVPIKFTANGNEIMRITHYGRVGIGTNNPGAPLDVSGSSASGTIALRVTNQQNSTFGEFGVSGSTYSYNAIGPNTTYFTASGGIAFGTDAASTASIYTWGAERLRVTHLGNVGIGTSSPSYKLDVSGTMGVSGNVTLSSGTANGVAYLNGSKVLTTGSALTFDGTNLGIGTGSSFGVAQREINVNAASGVASVNLGVGGTLTGWLYSGASNTNLSTYGNYPLIFGINGSEQMRLTSTGFGIGTSSPISRLTTAQSASGSTAYVDFMNTGAGNTANRVRIRMPMDSAISNATYIGNAPYIEAIELDASSSASALAFGTSAGYANAAERMRLDSSGNVGIGTTGSYTSRLNVFSSGSGVDSARFSDGVNSTLLIRHYATNVAALDAYSTLGFMTGGSERMRIDSSGNVGIGTSSPNFPLTVKANSGANAINIVARAGDDYGILAFRNAANSAEWASLWSGTNYMAMYTAGTERMRIDSSGNLKFNSGYGSVATAYGCRAWVNFNGTGTVAIRASGNVSSITDIVTGYFRVNFSTAMPDANYSVNNTCDDGAYGAVCVTANLRQNVAPTTTYVDVSTSNTSSGRTSADFLYNSVAIFR